MGDILIFKLVTGHRVAFLAQEVHQIMEVAVGGGRIATQVRTAYDQLVLDATFDEVLKACMQPASLTEPK